MITRASPTSDSIAGPAGLPFLGSTLSFLAAPREFAERLHNRYGPVSRVRYFGKDVVFLLGADANEAVLLDRHQSFSSSGGWAYIGEFFRGGLMLRDFGDHREHRRLLQDSFRQPALRRYAVLMSSTVANDLEGWREKADGGAYWAVRQLMMRTALTTLLGMAEERGAALGRHFMRTLEATYGLLPRFVPGSARQRGIESRRWLEVQVGELVDIKRMSPGDDLLSQLIGKANAVDSSLTREMIVDHIIFLMMAAHDTTTSTLTAAIASLIDHPEWQDEVRAELATVDLAEPTLEQLAALPITEAVLNEAMRLHAPLGSIPRFTVKPVPVSGVVVPAGRHVIVSPDFVHRSPEHWPNPELFQPQRFLCSKTVAERHRFAWVPFGGGAHKCLGYHFAYLQAKILLAHLLRKWRLAGGSASPRRWIDLPMPRPHDGLPLRIERI
ncbi:MAG TPA: cytochrome P450 [Allosphingosinicella sp.]|nr:cytochrome P450 [Allosphingosinicella sp.]